MLRQRVPFEYVPSVKNFYVFFLHIDDNLNPLLHTDINECITDTSECNQICTDTNGSYVCDCYSGYVLQSDGKTCSKDTSK